MAYHVVDRSTDGLRESAIVEVGWDGFQLLDDEIVTALVKLIGAHPRLHVGFDHIQDACGEAARGAHFGLFCWRFDGHVHKQNRGHLYREEGSASPGAA